MILLWPVIMLLLGIKKLILLLVSLHSWIMCLIAILMLMSVLMWDFKKKGRHLSYNLDSPFEPSLMPGIWAITSVVIPEIRDIELPSGTYKVGKVCWN